MTAIDTYALQARVVPVVVVCMPPLVLLGAGIITTSALGISAGLVTTALAALASQLGRDRGRALQPGLWAGWGGAPTVIALRHREAEHPGRVARAHECITAVTDMEMPTASEEAADPAAADERYGEAAVRLIARTRDKEKFGLLGAENQSYGQRRNLLGLKGVGIAVAVLTLVAAIVLFAVTEGTADERLARYAPAAVVAIVLLTFWLLVVRKSWVRVPADAYARQLIETAETLVAERAVPR
ncbi:hypothetical protein [Conexibacter sp. CPCC 206217]|uniref:hypothetical protein n=1 Tax=Conexibacter sp. CPCC 206217 TaxID=3064574 RepID=UPI00271A1171|nr:hypothetical protein [Conexibacter sp. CPCC 206217]MDO8208980.1 hypothetical protein [Conexibacter sp. CPCC 206217]